MSLFKKDKDRDALWLYFECGACSEKIKVRIDKKTDLQSQQDDDTSGSGAYLLRKEVLGNRCFNLIFADIRFDARYNIMTSKVKNGRIITEEEYRK